MSRALPAARLVLEVTGSRSKLVYGALPPDDPKVRRPDITRARDLLDWEPKTSLREGLTLTVPYFESQVRGGGSDPS